MSADKNATLFAKKEIVIDAPIEKIWKIQTDFQNWPTWQKEISSVELEGDIKIGTKFKWRAMGMGISSVLEEVEKEKVIGWTGKAFGMSAIHFWYFEKKGTKTKVRTEESMTGWAPKLIKKLQPKFLDESLIKALEALKKETEK